MIPCQKPGFHPSNSSVEEHHAQIITAWSTCLISPIKQVQIPKACILSETVCWVILKYCPQVHIEYAKKPSTVNHLLLQGPGRGHCPHASHSHKTQDVSHFILKLCKNLLIFIAMKGRRKYISSSCLLLLTH